VFTILSELPVSAEGKKIIPSVTEVYFGNK
jgi:hypothetical protein